MKASAGSSKIEHTSSQYDAIYTVGGHEGVYELPYQHSSYYPLFRRVLRTILEHNVQNLLEVGCGTGGFAQMVSDKGGIEYRGFDFSPIAVEKSRQRVGNEHAFYVADATKAETYDGSYDAIVCTEVLEHIDADRDVIAQWRPGTLCICSVPNFDADNHVRFFSSESAVLERYGDLLEITNIRRVKKPELSDISLASYLKALRWNRYRPRKIAEILGLTSFDSAGGWFLFVGRRVSA